MQRHIDVPQHSPPCTTRPPPLHAPYIAQPKPRHANPDWLTENLESRAGISAYDVDLGDWPNYPCHTECHRRRCFLGTTEASAHSPTVHSSEPELPWLCDVSPSAATLPEPSFGHIANKAYGHLPAELMNELGLLELRDAHSSPDTVSPESDTNTTTSPDPRHTQLLDMVLREIAQQQQSSSKTGYCDDAMGRHSRIPDISHWNLEQLCCEPKVTAQEAQLAEELLDIVNSLPSPKLPYGHVFYPGPTVTVDEAQEADDLLSQLNGEEGDARQSTGIFRRETRFDAISRPWYVGRERELAGDDGRRQKEVLLGILNSEGHRRAGSLWGP
ncbi:hypothetical protein NEOLEDRAFT_1133450 [Neolentinus lepideus HHB14362 ss-1]|uniref:Uncharacterized protein n=1 Tax=Neolentinus lepideus HHB14362 ss-1 TaxID=1314782 RepID=A0A165SPZ6_9AGAM|nr:hypothetical protein NEOLEDRAFT_1133450 [Neolentinus lepideus HHB14362 ss-1]